MKKILVIGTEPSVLLNFRKDLLKSFLKSGFSVTTITNPMNGSESREFSSLGVRTEKVTFSRNGLNPFSDIKVFFNLIRKLRLGDASIVLAYTIKPVVWGGLTSRLLNLDFYALITGLGFAFQGESFKRRFLTNLVTFLYKIALKNSKAVIFQNKDNRNIFIEKGIVPRSKTHVVNGSGVNIKKYSISRFPKTHFSFLCVSRLLGEKGLREYAAAARIVKDKFPDVKFDLVGPEDSSPDAISLEEVSGWSDYVNYNGSTNDVRPYIEECHIYVLPSHHEGLPRSTLEAMSMGRPILTTNAVGCKETVEEGINGFMVPVGSTIKLAEKMIWYIENEDKIQSMGKESRSIVENKFDVHKVNKEMLRILGVE
jgi:glycosyltransferase involved in cell wall biosynthesis